MNTENNYHKQNNVNSLLILLAVKNCIQCNLQNYFQIIKSIFNSKNNNNNWSHENLKVKNVFAPFVLFIVVVAFGIS